MNIAKRKKALIEELKNKEYRDAFISEHIDTGIPFQIRALRKQRGWGQEDLAKHAGKKQEQISRLENPNYARFRLSTLKELASVFDVGLVVRFVPISDLVKWELELTSESLEAESFDQDSYFEDKPDEISSTEQASISLSDATESSLEDYAGTIAATANVIPFSRAIAENQTFNTSRLNQCSA